MIYHLTIHFISLLIITFLYCISTLFKPTKFMNLTKSKMKDFKLYLIVTFIFIILCVVQLQNFYPNKSLIENLLRLCLTTTVDGFILCLWVYFKFYRHQVLNYQIDKSQEKHKYE